MSGPARPENAPIPIEGPDNGPDDGLLDSEDIVKAKAALRREMKKLVAAMSAENRFAASERVADHIRALPEWRKARAVLFYHALPDEVDLECLMDEAIQSGREVLLPVCNESGQDEAGRTMRIVGVTNLARDLREGTFGIMEPVAGIPLECTDTLDLVLVPGRAFDRQGGRLGRGKGYYDGFLGALRPRRADGPFKLGVAFSRQIVGAVPMQARDVRMDAVVSEEGVPGPENGN